MRRKCFLGVRGFSFDGEIDFFVEFELSKRVGEDGGVIGTGGIDESDGVVVELVVSSSVNIITSGGDGDADRDVAGDSVIGSFRSLCGEFANKTEPPPTTPDWSFRFLFTDAVDL